ncbi:MAG: hypothetical protein IJK47_07050 [Lachnospiraceae bacterium]|nr:hypothetical protein [Lachnospiraceae bacterium]
MKKLIAMLLAIMMVLSLVACGNNEGTKTEAQTQETAETTTVAPVTEAPTTEAPTESPTEATTERPLSDFELCAEYAVSKIRDILKNPSSMVVNHLYGVEYEGAYIYAVDYSAQNGLGGYGRDTIYITVKKTANGFAVTTYGSQSFSNSTNQKYTSQFYSKAAAKGYYEFDATTYRLIALWN